MNANIVKTTLVTLLLTATVLLCGLLVACNSVVFKAPPPLQNAQPVVSSLSPSFAVTGSTSQAVTLTGTGFLPSSSVTYNGITHAATYISGQLISISLTREDLGTPGNYTIAAINPAPGGGTSAAMTFGVLETLTEPTTGLTFSFPDLGTLKSIEIDNPSPGITNMSPFMQASGSTTSVSGFDITIYANPNNFSLQAWFERNIDVNDILISSGAYQQQQLSDGSTALVMVGEIPEAYITAGGSPPYSDAYRIANNGQIVSITQSSEPELYSYGYVTASVVQQLELAVLESVHF